MLKRLFDSVFEPDPYTELDDIGIANAYAGKDGAFYAMCMDETAAGKPVCVVRTQTEGCYDTVGVTYGCRLLPDTEAVLKTGIRAEFRRLIPCLSAQIMNMAGLYVKRCAATPEEIEACARQCGISGTNPNGETRVPAVMLPRLIAEHCGTVQEALAFVKKLDIRMPAGENGTPVYRFFLADAAGEKGMLHIDNGGLHWHPGQETGVSDEKLTAAMQCRDAAALVQPDLVKRSLSVRFFEDEAQSVVLAF